MLSQESENYYYRFSKLDSQDSNKALKVIDKNKNSNSKYTILHLPLLLTTSYQGPFCICKSCSQYCYSKALTKSNLYLIDVTDIENTRHMKLLDQKQNWLTGYMFQTFPIMTMQFNICQSVEQTYNIRHLAAKIHFLTLYI